jgi:hypothetical protein
MLQDQYAMNFNAPLYVPLVCYYNISGFQTIFVGQQYDDFLYF